MAVVTMPAVVVGHVQPLRQALSYSICTLLTIDHPTAIFPVGQKIFRPYREQVRLYFNQDDETVLLSFPITVPAVQNK